MLLWADTRLFYLAKGLISRCCHSHVEWFEGNFQDYEDDKKRRLGDAAVEPHRIKFKRFERR